MAIGVRLRGVEGADVALYTDLWLESTSPRFGGQKAGPVLNHSLIDTSFSAFYRRSHGAS